MQADVIRFTVGTTGVTSIPVAFEPQILRFTVSRKSSGAETNVAHFSYGVSNADGSVQKVHCVFDDDNSTNSPYTQFYDQYCVAHIARESGNITRVLSASYQGYDALDGEIDLNFDAADSSYQITLEIEG